MFTYLDTLLLLKDGAEDEGHNDGVYWGVGDTSGGQILGEPLIQAHKNRLDIEK